MKQKNNLIKLFALLLLFLSACSTVPSKEDSTEPSVPEKDQSSETISDELTVRNLSDEYTVKDRELSESFNTLFDRLWSVKESTEEVIFLPDHPYETEASTAVRQGDKSLGYCFFGHHSDENLKDAENVLYMILSDGKDTRGYLIPEKTDLHRQIGEFIESVQK